MSAIRERQDDLEFGPEVELPVELEWAGGRWPASSSTNGKGRELAADGGGFAVQQRLSVRVRLNAVEKGEGLRVFGEVLPLPEALKSCRVSWPTLEGLFERFAEFRIDTVTDCHRAFLVLQLVDAGSV